MNRKLLLILSAILCGLSSCGLNVATQEEEDMASGRIYALEKGVVTYNNGIVLTFCDYGHKQRLDYIYCDSVHFLSINRDSYVVNTDKNVYYQIPNASYFTGMAEREDYLHLDAKYKEDTITFAGVTCRLFTNRTAKTEEASYRRIRMYDNKKTPSTLDLSTNKAFHNLYAQTITTDIETYWNMSVDAIFALANTDIYNYYPTAYLDAVWEISWWILWATRFDEYSVEETWL